MKLEDLFKKCLENEYLREYNVEEISDEELKNINNTVSIENKEILKKMIKYARKELLENENI
jgi:hypothetical protein